MYGKLYRGATRQVTAAWGMNDKRPGSNLNAFLVESAFGFSSERHVGFFRIESVEKDDLFLPSNPRAGEVFTVNKGSLGYVYNFAYWKPLRLGVGGLVSISAVPGAIKDIYGGSPASYMLFLRMNLVEK
jgi:hypothetical protein